MENELLEMDDKLLKALNEEIIMLKQSIDEHFSNHELLNQLELYNISFLPKGRSVIAAEVSTYGVAAQVKHCRFCRINGILTYWCGPCPSE
jgi:hypothetical protein